MSGCTFTSPSNLALQPGVTKSLKMNEDTCSQYLLSAPGQNSLSIPTAVDNGTG